MKRFCTIFLLALMASAYSGAASDRTRIQYLSGTGSDNTVEWDFFCTAGRGSGKWTTIPVPSCWECQGFGEYVYGQMPFDTRLSESGIYRHKFTVPADWKGRVVDMVFEGVMTDTEVLVNGKKAGEKHQGGYCEFRYDVSKLLRYGRENSIEVRVDKESSNRSVVGAERECDFWIYGGIYRPVYLEAKPAVHLENVSIDAGASGKLELYFSVAGKVRGAAATLEVFAPDGQSAGKFHFTGDLDDLAEDEEAAFDVTVKDPQLWSAEYPNLYSYDLALEKDGKVLHSVGGKFGFRTIELRPHDGVYVNGTKIMFKGVNRHSHWPTTGRTLNHSINLQDAQLIKEMNMNAVRMSHYPPEKDFLDICDSLGLYVLDELTGWQDCYDTGLGTRLVRELVSRDRNHPCVLMWDNGNEGGFNFDLVPVYSEVDPQKRPVIHPWQKEDGWNTFHYPTWEEARYILKQERNVYFPTEFIHGLYDGGHGAGLEDYWELFRSSPLSAGGFLWDLVDQGLVRDDRDGFIDTDGDHGADGIVGPYREKEGSFYTIRDIWCPVQVEGGKYLPSCWNGTLTVENRYDFTNLSECRFEAEYSCIDFLTGERRAQKYMVESPDVAPGMKGKLLFERPEADCFDFLTLRAFDRTGMELYAWTFINTSASEYAPRALADNSGCSMTVEAGMLKGLMNGDRELSFGKGLRAASHPDRYSVDCSMTGNGWVEVRYSLLEDGQYDNIGVTFDLPEDSVKGVRWLGNGPFRVWKNRIRGVEAGLWEKDYNDTRTGQTFDYPEFKGYHSGLYAADIITTSGTLRIVSDTDELFLHLLNPASQGNDNVAGRYPDGNISILSAISPIGNKFRGADTMGPSGLKNTVNTGHGPLCISGHFYMTLVR